ncbi:MAG TPA: T9SS type A sorting domain-containing protein [Ignavibacteriaceae bacterium]|nr:T9SS type A sorting domain-containing protein [Ignavibacteriaceae bacterium]
MKKIYTILMFLFTITNLFSQATFSSNAWGNWNDNSIWTLTSGNDEDGYPDENDDVIITAGCVININDNVACKNLSFEAAAKVYYNTSNKNLTVTGNINGVNTSEDYTSSTNATSTKLIFTGSLDQILTSTSGGASTNWPNVEVNKTSGNFTINQNIRIDGNLTITSGILDANSNAISMSSSSSILVMAYQQLIKVGRIAQTTGGTSPINNLNIDGLVTGSNLYLTNLNVNSTGTLDLIGTTGFSASLNPTNMVCANGSTVKYSYSSSQTCRFSDYHNLILSGGIASGSATKTISAVGTITINGDLTISNGARLSTGGNIVIKGTTNINDNGEIIINASNTCTFNGTVNINGNSANGVIRFGSAVTDLPVYTLNGDVNISSSTTNSAFNLNSGTLSTTNNSFSGKLIFNGNINIGSTASTFTSVSTSYPPSTNIYMGGIDKKISILSGSSSFINLRGNYVFTTNREIQSSLGTAFTFTSKPNSVTPEWTIKIDNGVTLKIAANSIVSLPNRVISDGTGSGNLEINGDLRVGLVGGWNSAIAITGIQTLSSTSTITFNGSLTQNTGNNLPTLNNLVINNSGSNTTTLSNDLIINGNLSVLKGDLDLNGKTITLGSSANLIETPGNTIKGSTGKIVTTRTFNAGDLSAGVNVAGLGAKIITDQALGETIIERYSNIQVNNSLNSINRMYKISPTNNSSLNASLEFLYDDSELGSLKESDLKLFKSVDGNNDSWNFVGGAVDVTNNKVLVNNVNDFSFWTLFESNLTPYTVPMTASFNNADAFGTKGLIGADQWTSYYAHWDNNYLYLGWNGGKTNYSSDMYYAAIDIDPDGNNGCISPIEGVSFKDGGPKPDIYVVYENNSSFYGAPASNGNAVEIYNGSSGTWNWVSRTDGNDNTSSKVVFSDNAGEVRLRIPWSTLGITPGASTKLGLVMWNNNGSGNWLWGRVPLQNPSHGSSVILDYQFIYNSTGAGVNPSIDMVSTPLPVELSSFSALAKGNNVQLNWKTATEKDNYGFDIERRVNNVWEKVGFVQGNGNSNSVKEYSFVDNSVKEGKYSYRLKQVDNSGKYIYSNVVEVELSIPDEYGLTQNYPNPFNPSTTISYKLPMQSKVQLNVYSISGELVSSLVNEEQSAGSYNINFDASKLATGTYIYRLIANDFVMTKKMLLIK